MTIDEIKSRMKSLDWVPEEVARRTKLSLRTVQRILSGEVKKPHTPTKKAIEDAISMASGAKAWDEAPTSRRRLNDWFDSMAPEWQVHLLTDMLLSMEERWMEEVLYRVKSMGELRKAQQVKVAARAATAEEKARLESGMVPDIQAEHSTSRAKKASS